MNVTITIVTTRGEVELTEYQTMAGAGSDRPTRSELDTLEAAYKAAKTWLRGHVVSEAGARARREVRPAPEAQP